MTFQFLGEQCVYPFSIIWLIPVEYLRMSLILETYVIPDKLKWVDVSSIFRMEDDTKDKCSYYKHTSS